MNALTIWITVRSMLLAQTALEISLAHVIQAIMAMEKRVKMLTNVSVTLITAIQTLLALIQMVVLLVNVTKAFMAMASNVPHAKKALVSIVRTFALISTSAYCQMLVISMQNAAIRYLAMSVLVSKTSLATAKSATVQLATSNRSTMKKMKCVSI